jgi:RNA polymerase sigma-70 factor (ECF subfamily)
MTDKEYNQCVNEHADSVYRFIFKNLRNKEDSRDVVQSAFEKMWVSRATVDGSRCKAFLFTVAYHQMIDHIRKGKMIVVKDDIIETVPVYNSHNQNTRKILETALARLNETHRSLVLLKDYEGYSYEEIGEITGLSPSQVKVYLHRARLQLKNYLVSPENILEQ